MTSLPPAFEQRMKTILQEEAEPFFQALQTPPPVSIRLNPDKPISASPEDDLFQAEKVAWCAQGRYLNERPIFTLNPCFHGGAFYVQEASSMFLHHVLKQILPSRPVRALDLCAAPGGKSTLTASLLPEGSLLCANEVIRSRASILRENVIKWGRADMIVSNNDPADFQGLEGAFDLISVDAPCSGEGMFRKEPKAITEWSETNLKLCSERQKRILSNIWPSLQPGGFLVYSTCTYNPGENEAILEWIAEELGGESILIEHSFNTITPAPGNAYGYHFYPHKTRGEGFFIGVMQKHDGTAWSARKSKKQNKVKPVQFPPELSALLPKAERFTAYLQENQLGFVPAAHSDFIGELENRLRVIYKGCEAVEIHNKKMKYLHPLALFSGLERRNCPQYEIDLDTALTYLKKEDIPISGRNGEWLLLVYRNIALGWGKNLGNRLNNYYPKEWRIRMRLDAGALSDTAE